MKSLRVHEIAEAIGGAVVQGNDQETISRVVTRASQFGPHTLLFGLTKNRRQLQRAIHPPSSGVVVTSQAKRYAGRLAGLTIIRVPNAHAAYWRFVRYYRGLFSLPVIGVTGTCGKTTTKEMIAHMLSGQRNVHYTEKSSNSLQRNLRYLLGIDESTDAAVFEMGVAAKNDLLHSCRYFQPQIGIITTIGVDHLQHCGTQENYIREKAKLLQGLQNQGTLILNADDANCQKIDLSEFRGRVITFGRSDGVDFQASAIRYTADGMDYTLVTGGCSYPVYVPGFGEHNVMNSLASLAAAQIVGMRLEDAIERLATFTHLEGHLEHAPGINGSLVLDDTWSSNPTSAEAAIKVLKQVSAGRKTVAVLGKMGLLGKYTKQQHEKIGKVVVEQGIDYLVTMDNVSRHIGFAALRSGMKPDNIYMCKHPRRAYNVLRRLLDQESVVLIKTSMLDSHSQFVKKITMRSKKV
ncbi:UDP-N-acetylmuramoyl-tripeptide--D-alanyl-D-alanine ligase [Brevibacillus fluminis]|uniref:UDP-N-acetylmuramoyl-tripeptide--D-alanyl-D- alanine ligase n=1 Tax=Brevibacillus fluminis TaxID=511487 RepID=UPI003F89F084